MKQAVTCVVCAVFLAFAATETAQVQGRGGGPKVHGPKTTVKSVPSIPKAPAAHGAKTTAARAPKTVTTHGPQTPAAKTTTPRTDVEHGAKPRATVTTPALTPTSDLPKNTRLVERLRLLLPPGTDMTLASNGFKNQGQFVAAVHVSNNLRIPFIDLRSRMIDTGMSLGQAIQALRPRVDYDAEAARAIRQATVDLNATSRSVNPKTRQ